MFRKILYPTDFSDVAKKGLEYIKRLKEAGTEQVVLVHVIDARTLREVRFYDSLEEKLKQETREDMATLAKQISEIGLKVESHIRVGVPFREILKMEKEDEEISLILLGSHGRSNIEEMLLGSVTEKVVRKCIKPVLVVKR